MGYIILTSVKNLDQPIKMIAEKLQRDVILPACGKQRGWPDGADSRAPPHAGDAAVERGCPCWHAAPRAAPAAPLQSWAWVRSDKIGNFTPGFLVHKKKGKKKKKSLPVLSTSRK